MWIKSLAFEAFVFFVLTFGAKVVGMCDATLQQLLETVTIKGMRWGTCSRSTYKGDSVMLKELNICSFLMYNVGQWVRSLNTYEGLKIWVVDLVFSNLAHKVG